MREAAKEAMSVAATTSKTGVAAEASGSVRWRLRRLEEDGAMADNDTRP